MQREKLYNLHKTAYFIVALFVFKMHKILINQISTVRKQCFLWYKMNSFFVISSSHQPICFIKEKNKLYQKMQREKLYNLQRTAYFIYAHFMSKILYDQFSLSRKYHFFSTLMKFLFSYFIYKINCSL